MEKAPRSRRGPSFIPTVEPVLQTGAHVDRVALFERHIGLLDVLARADLAAEALHLALGDPRVHRLHLHTEQRRGGLPDLRDLAYRRCAVYHTVVTGGRI